MVVPLGLGIGDLIQVSNLAFKLYRRCRDSSDEFKTLSQEGRFQTLKELGFTKDHSLKVASLRLVVDDVRVTILEHDVEGEKVEQILHIGQGCLDCLLELEELLRKYERLGSRHKRTWDRLRWDKDKVNEIRQRVITNTNFLSSFNLSLTRSSTSRIESLLRQFLDDWKRGELEGSIVSMETIKTIEEGNEDVWKELGQELEDAGITEEQINDNKQFITQWIKQAILTGNVENRSLTSVSFHTASEGAPSTVLSGLTLTGDDIQPGFDFPGDEFLLTKDLVHSVDHLYKDAPEEFIELQDQVSSLLQVMLEIQVGMGDTQSLYYHEKLVRKEKMEATLPPLNDSLKQLQELVDKFKTRTSDDEIEWVKNEAEMRNVQLVNTGLRQEISDLDQEFRDLGTLMLATLEDRLKRILQDTKDGKHEYSILHSWDELEVLLADGSEIRIDDVRAHREAVTSFVQVSIEEHESSRRDSLAFSNSETLQESLNSRIQSVSSPKLGLQKSEGSVSELGRSRSSFTGSLPSDTTWTGDGLSNKPKRASVLFVDWNNEVRSPMAQAYLEHLKAAHPPLASHFSRVLSAGLSVAKLGVALPAGLGLMLRDCGVSENFVHTSRRIERRDAEKYEYVLVMNSRQIEDILAFWPSREEAEQQGIAATNNTMVREDIEGRIHLLGSFGNEGMREVSLPESIGGEYWFQMGTRRIYPGYEKCWSEIKKYVADFIFDLTGYDVNSHAEHSADDNSREVSEDELEDYGEAFLNMSYNPWAEGEERSPFDELSKTITSIQEAEEGNSPMDHFSFNPDSQISIMIAEQQPIESDEEILHKHHEQFERLVSLLSTDVDHGGISALRSQVVEWEQDPIRVLLTVSTGPVKWVLQKSPTDAADGCALCGASGIRSGLVLDNKLEVISKAEADLVADYLNLAIQQSNQQSTEEEESSQLEHIRDNPGPRPVPVAPSMRDDVSVSVRNDSPLLAHNIERIRQKDGQQVAKLKGQSPAVGSQTPDEPVIGSLTRRRTGEIDVLSDLMSNTGARPPPRQRLDSDSTVVPLARNLPLAKTQKNGIEKAVTKAPTAKKPVSVLFLSSTHLHGAIMAEIYLFSLLDKDNALALRICDVVSAGVSEVTPDQKLHPRKLERLFKAKDLLQCWPQKPERLLVPEDIVEFDYILLLNGASFNAPYAVWADDNPDEAEDMQESTKEGEDWRANFKTKVLDLSTFCSNESQRGKSFPDPVQPGQGDKFGVKFKKFEQAFAQVKDAVDQFLLKELKFNVEEMCFFKRRKTEREGQDTPSPPGERVSDSGE